MSSWLVPPVGLSEPFQVQEIFIDGIGAIELLNSATVRIHLIQEQMPLEVVAGIGQGIVVAKLVVALPGVPQMIGQLAQCLWKPPIVMPGTGPRLVSK